MKILQCVADLNPIWGGTVEAARLLTVELLKQGHSVEILTLAAPRPEFMNDWGTVAHCPGPSSTYYLYNKHLVPWLESHAADYDVLIVHGVWRYMSLGTWRGLRASGVPYVLYTHGMLDPFHNRFWWKRLKKIAMWRLVEHRVLRDAGRVIFTCEEELLLSSGNFKPWVCKPVVLNFGVGLPPEENRNFVRPQDCEGKETILFLGRLQPQKGCDTLIRAFARVAAGHPKLHLLIAGPDLIGWKAELEELAKSCGVSDRITWCGPVFGEAKWQLLHHADAYISPTNYENFGISIVEALACGLPVLVSDKTSIWREIESADAGFVATNTVEGMAAILSEWVLTTKERRGEMSNNARRCFQQNYAIESVAQKLADVLESVARKQ